MSKGLWVSQATLQRRIFDRWQATRGAKSTAQIRALIGHHNHNSVWNALVALETRGLVRGRRVGYRTIWTLCDA